MTSIFSKMKYFLVVMCFAVVGGATIDDYCAVRPSSTPCRTQCARAEQCGRTLEHFIELCDEEREEILQRHNQLRDEVSGGDHDAHNIPPIPNMRVLSYDLELEFLASCWIQQCRFAREDRAQRRTLDDQAYNQNIYRLSTPIPRKFPAHFLTGAINFWFGEWKFLPAYNVSQNDSDVFTLGGVHTSTAHLAQIIWPETQFIGCAKMHHKRWIKDNSSVLNLGHGYYVVCNYAPPADAKPEISMMENKGACQKAMGGDYSNLCGEERNFKDDSYAAPINFESAAYGSANRVEIFSLVWVFAYTLVIFKVAPYVGE